MQKIISLFQRNYDGDRLLRDEVTPGAEWVLAGQGEATVKWDGTCCMVKDGVLYKRYDAKKGKTPPEGFISAQEPDPITGHWPGWIAIPSYGECPENKWHREAFKNTRYIDGGSLPDGTYELIGPKINGNKERVHHHQFVKHGDSNVFAPRTYEELKAFFADYPHEGIVWHHPDGRMVKIKKKDFGYKW